ncbi:unnamed protein product, partial [Ectocarpus sp. 12 AP-2014]
RRAPEEILDLCSGSGVQGITAAVLRGGEASVTCVDINPRAVRFSRFNALLNGLNAGGGEEEGGRFRAVVGDLYGALDSKVGGRTGTSGATPTRTPTSSSPLYDLILANPPFVPVPPRLGSARRRYDVFASGGSNGEEVIERIFRGAFDRLRPGSGLLAMVTELANPRAFDAKLRRWIGGEEEEGRESRRSDQGWAGTVLHERQPWTAREYAERRAGSRREAEGWERHLRGEGIEEMAAGFVFV